MSTDTNNDIYVNVVKYSGMKITKIGLLGFLDISDSNKRKLLFDADPNNSRKIHFQIDNSRNTLIFPPLSFCAMDNENNPGFIWIGKTPKESIFSIARTSDTEITVTNKHFKRASETDHTCGEWFYQIFAQDKAGKIFGMPWTTCNGPGDSNPSIRNK